jgi:hypothetical protein
MLVFTEKNLNEGAISIKDFVKTAAPWLDIGKPLFKSFLVVGKGMSGFGLGGVEDLTLAHVDDWAIALKGAKNDVSIPFDQVKSIAIDSGGIDFIMRRDFIIRLCYKPAMKSMVTLMSR